MAKTKVSDPLNNAHRALDLYTRATKAFMIAILHTHGYTNNTVRIEFQTFYSRLMVFLYTHEPTYFTLW